MQADLQLNVPQQVFTLFYAITWGTAANSQPRWRAFAWGAIFSDRHSWRRALLSTVVLNVFPSIYFVLILWFLSSGAWANLYRWNLNALWKIFVSIIPALAPFGFYRLWISCVEYRRDYFYGVSRAWKDGDPNPVAWERIGLGITIECDLSQEFAYGNFLWGVIYVLMGALSAGLVRYLGS